MDFAAFINQRPISEERFCNSWVFPTTGTNSLRAEITLSLLKRNRRSQSPLFHVQPIGCPFMIQTKIGFSVAADSRRASFRSVSQGIDSHLSSAAVGSKDATLASKPSGTNTSAATTTAKTIPRLYQTFPQKEWRTGLRGRQVRSEATCYPLPEPMERERTIRVLSKGEKASINSVIAQRSNRHQLTPKPAKLPGITTPWDNSAMNQN